MEYINAEDDDSDNVFVDSRDSIHSLHFILFKHFFDESVTREAKWHHRRMKWEAHVIQLQHENLFKRTYRMTLGAFQKLTRILGKTLLLMNLAAQCMSTFILRSLLQWDCDISAAANVWI